MARVIAPLVSVVMATYNRSNILRFSIGSLLRSTVQEWELLVVGDACTDDTGEIVRAFGDERIQFLNLPRHCGEQSGPNNEGLRRARGRYIAFLNHDDFWLSDHLEASLQELDRTGADLVFTLALTIDYRDRTRFAGVTKRGVYDRLTFAPASTWVFRRELVDAIGLWRPATSLFLSPSTEWLERANRARRRLVGVEKVTAIVLFSGSRQNTYAERQQREHEQIADGLQDEAQFVRELMTAGAVRMTRDFRTGLLSHLYRAARNAAYTTFGAIGVHPGSIVRALRYWRRGGFIDRLRRNRGLPPLPRERSS